MKLRYLFLMMLVCIFGTSSQAQYFQQKVDVNIDAELFDKTHTIHAKATISYTNNSKQALSSIIFHLWANAYSKKNTAFGEQQLAKEEREFYFSDESDLGGYKEIVFSVQGTTLEIANYKDHVDIVNVMLPKVLEEGETIIIECDYALRIPKPFSRMGRVEGGYNLTQWFPKPAVFDQDGWHPMPYLDQGEFYSEFGNYHINLTLPTAYVVAGTGQLQTEEEYAILRQMAVDGTAYPNDEGQKTLCMTASRVHDFALFLHKNFRVRHTEKIINGNTIDCWAYFREGSSETWERAAEYVSNALSFYSSEVGDYPFPQATAVEGVTTGGGMEYPMVTIIGDTESAMSLDEVITHEVGHNWFYGILASNERSYPWLDEGFNTYIEMKYMKAFYGDTSRFNLDILSGKDKSPDLEKESLRFQIVRGFDQAGGNSSEDFKGINYGLMAYYKPAYGLKLLEEYVGEERMRNALKNVYNKGKFSHVSPKKVRQSMESSLNEDLTWLFDDWLITTKVVDYGIEKVKIKNEKTKVTLINKGQVESPLALHFYKNDELISKEWIKGFKGKEKFEFNYIDADRIVLGEEEGSLDFGVTNNHYNISSSMPKAAKLKIRYFPFFNDGSTADLLLIPAMGWNLYDGFQLGLHLGNMGIIPKKFVWNITPKFGFDSQDIVGTADAHYNFIQHEGKVRNIQIGAKYKRYTFFENERADYTLDYNRYETGVRFLLRGSEQREEHQEVYARATFYDVERARHTTDSSATSVRDWGSQYNAGYIYERCGALNPFISSIDLEFKPYTIGQGNSESREHYIRLGLTHQQSLYYKPEKKIDLRVFGGIFIYNSRRDAGSVLTQLAENSLGLTHQGIHDDFRYNFGGRSEQDGFWSHQIVMEEGGFKNAFSTAYANVIGNSNSMIAAINLKADNPLNIPIINLIKPYFDIGFFDDRQPSRGYDLSKELLWSGGLMLELGDGIFGVYLPIINSGHINDIYKQHPNDSFWNRMSFSINLLKLNPYELAETYVIKL